MVTHIALNRIQTALNEVHASSPHATEAVRGEVPVVARTGIQAFMANAEEPIPRLDAEALESAVKDIETSVRGRQRSLQFSVDEASGQTIIKVIDKETDEVIRQIPPAEIIAIARRIEDAVGLFVTEEA